MFRDSSFNGDISGWNVTAVTSMADHMTERDKAVANQATEIDKALRIYKEEKLASCTLAYNIYYVL